jgi:hypothetical protein
VSTHSEEVQALALARMNVDLAPLIKAGAIFEYSDLRGFDLSGANFSSARLSGSDFSGADIASAKFKATQLDNATFLRVRGAKADFSDADLAWVSIKESFFALANFTGAKLSHVSIVGGDFTGSLFDQAEYDKLSFVDVACLELPSGLPWPESIQSSAPVPPVGSKKVRHTFEGTLSLESVLLRQGPMVRPNFRPLLP